MRGTPVVTGKKINRESTAVSSNYPANADVLGVTDTSVERTITIPTALIAAGNRVFRIVDESGGATANHIIIATEGAETIEGQSTLTIDVNYGCVALYSDGSNLFTYP